MTSPPTFDGGMQGSRNPFGNFGGRQQQFGGFGGFGGQQQQMQSPFAGNQGFGGFGGFAPQQQMMNPFMGGQGFGGFGGFGGYGQMPMQQMNPFMGGQGFGGFGGFAPQQQMMNPFMGGQGFGGFGGYGQMPMQQMNPFMGGQKFGGFDRSFGGYENPFMGGQDFGDVTQQQAEMRPSFGRESMDMMHRPGSMPTVSPEQRRQREALMNMQQQMANQGVQRPARLTLPPRLEDVGSAAAVMPNRYGADDGLMSSMMQAAPPGTLR